MLEYILIGFVMVYAAYEAWAHQVERRRAIDRERELLSAVLSKHVAEYVEAVQSLRKTEKGRLAEMKLENELAEAAVKLEGEKGIPVR